MRCVRASPVRDPVQHMPTKATESKLEAHLVKRRSIWDAPDRPVRCRSRRGEPQATPQNWAPIARRRRDFQVLETSHHLRLSTQRCVVLSPSMAELLPTLPLSADESNLFSHSQHNLERLAGAGNPCACIITHVLSFPTSCFFRFLVPRHEEATEPDYGNERAASTAVKSRSASQQHSTEAVWGLPSMTNFPSRD